MADILVDERDQKFILFEQFEIDKFSESEIYSEFDAETYHMVLNQAKKLATNVMMPTNAAGDTEGCLLKDGKVSVPKSFHDLWRKWNEGGWRGLDLPQEMGGHGMPMVVGMAANEYFEAGNLAFQTLAAMTRGAALLIATHGTEDQKKKYVEKILSGKWTGTMVMTEAEAGSDVGATKTKAERNQDGTYSITGSKMLITGGDTDLTENIIHLALARVKGAPAGTQGLSLFLVPKIKVNPDGSLGEPNDVKTISIEKKMGLKGSPTCHLNFGEEGKCIGELVGKENQGLPIFFTMMNESRLIAARHGAAVASTAYLHALAYARERLQGTEIGAPKGFGPGTDHQTSGRPPHASSDESVYRRHTRSHIICLLLYRPGKNVSQQGREARVGKADCISNTGCQGLWIGHEFSGNRNSHAGLRRLRIHEGLPHRAISER